MKFEKVEIPSFTPESVTFFHLKPDGLTMQDGQATKVVTGLCLVIPVVDYVNIALADILINMVRHGYRLFPEIGDLTMVREYLQQNTPSELSTLHIAQLAYNNSQVVTLRKCPLWIKKWRYKATDILPESHLLDDLTVEEIYTRHDGLVFVRFS
jgi:hypothetical protein